MEQANMPSPTTHTSYHTEFGRSIGQNNRTGVGRIWGPLGRRPRNTRLTVHVTLPHLFAVDIYAVVTTTIRLRFDGRSTVVRLFIVRHKVTVTNTSVAADLLAQRSPCNSVDMPTYIFI